MLVTRQAGCPDLGGDHLDHSELWELGHRCWIKLSWNVGPEWQHLDTLSFDSAPLSRAEGETLSNLCLALSPSLGFWKGPVVTRMMSLCLGYVTWKHFTLRKCNCPRWD